MKDLEIRLFWIIWVDPESNDKCIHETPRERTERRQKPCEDGGRDKRDAGNHDLDEEVREGPPLEPPKEV